MRKTKIHSLWLLSLLTTMACQEEEPSLSPSQLLEGRQWKLESRIIEQPDEIVKEVSLDYCDVELWEFKYDILSIDYHFISLAGQECTEESYSLNQSFLLLDDRILLKGYQQELTEHWKAIGTTLADMQLALLDSDRIQLVYHLTKSDSDKPTATTVIDTLVLYATTGSHF